MKLLLSLFVFLATVHVNADFMPPNNLHLQDNINSRAGITEVQFNAIIDRFEKVYGPIIESHGATLKVNRLWTNATVNASAEQTGTTWIVNMYGGLARRAEVTADGFALVVCHELGHHLGGFAFKGERWAANEGQSDYYATQACARHMWANDTTQNEQSVEVVDPFARNECAKAWTSKADQNLCYRIVMAGLSLGTLLNNGVIPKFDKPDLKIVTMTNDAHPKGQCRLDTYFNGALCGTSFDMDVIPAKGHVKGQNSKEAEIVASKYSCGKTSRESIGARPACWFFSKLGTQAKK
jgi:hypothetical protein